MTVERDFQVKASRSVVHIRSFKGAAHYKSCIGIIVEAFPNMALIAVHKSNINPKDNDVIWVRFFNNMLKRAEILVKKTSMIRIIRVRLEPPLDIPFDPVTSFATKMTRSDIFLFYGKGLKDMDIFITSVIDPSTGSSCTRSNSGTIVTRREDWFTFGCRVGIQDLIGAPVFSATGMFVGMVHGNHPTIHLGNVKSGKDLIYANQAINFIPKALRRIKAKLETE